MDAQMFLAEFGHIVNATGGIAQLRQMIYQAAVTGFLTQRGDRAEDAGQLLSRIEQERQRLIRAKRYKRMPKLESEPIRPPQGIQLPESWRWSRLLDIGEINPRNEAPDDLLAAFVPMSGIPQLHKAPIVSEIKRWGEINKGYTHFADGDVVLAKITPCFENGKAAVVENLPDEARIGSGTTELQVVRPIHPGVLPGYVYLFLRSPLFTVEGEKSMTGTAGQKRVPTDYFATRAFPLPPTEEQTRIVARVDELMALCNRLEEQQERRLALQGQLRETALSAVAMAQNQAQLKVAWARAERNLAFLVEKPEHVSQFQDAAFNLALHGYLHPSSQLTNTTSTEDEGLSPLPLGWRWDTLAGLSDDITSGSRGWKAYLAPRGDAFIRSQDIKHDALIFENPAWVSLPDKTEGTRTLVRPGDILLTITGGNVGKCAVVPPLSYKAYVSQHVALIRLSDPTLAGFVHFWMTNAYGGRRYLSRYIYGDKPGLNLTQVGSVPVPVPPSEVVEEILEGLRTYETNFRLLEKQLRSKEQLAKSLATAAVSALTGISAANDEDDTVKAPQTELIAPLCLGATPNVKELAPLATILARHQGEMSAKDLWQRFGGEIDVFYAQLKTEVANGWIQEPAIAEMREVPQAQASA